MREREGGDNIRVKSRKIVERKTEAPESERERERESVCVCVCVVCDLEREREREGTQCWSEN